MGSNYLRLVALLIGLLMASTAAKAQTGACAFSPCKPSVIVQPNSVLQSDQFGNLAFGPSYQSSQVAEVSTSLCGGTVDATTAINAAITGLGSGTVYLPSCGIKIAGTAHLTSNIRLTSYSPIYYVGMLDTSSTGSAVAPTWPPTTGESVNCTNTGGACLSVEGIGVEIDHVNLGNPQPTPPASCPDSGPCNNYTPTSYGPIISTVAADNWNGFHLHDFTMTSATTCIDLEGSPNYNTSGIAGAQWTINDGWLNGCLNTGIKLYRIDNTGRISNIDMDWWWYRNNGPVGYYMENNAVGMDFCYAANTQISKVEFLYSQIAMKFSNCTVTGGFGHTAGADNLQFDQIGFNLVCQAVSVPAGVSVTAIFTNTIAAEDNSWCGGGATATPPSAFFSMPSDSAFITMLGVRGGSVQTFASIGAGTAGNLWISGLNVAAYSNFSTGSPAFKIGAGAHFSLLADLSAIVPAASAGALEGPGENSSGQGYMQPLCVGGGSIPGEGSACLSGSGSGNNSGALTLWDESAIGQAFVGAATSGGLNIKSLNGSVDIESKNSSHTGTVTFGTDTSGNNLDNYNPLPTSPPSGTGSLYKCVDNMGNDYVKASCP